jgi:hypothetical protein
MSHIFQHTTLPAGTLDMTSQSVTIVQSGKIQIIFSERSIRVVAKRKLSAGIAPTLGVVRPLGGVARLRAGPGSLHWRNDRC